MAEQEPKRQMRYSDEELRDIKAFFTENTLMVIRKFLFQGELSEGEQVVIDGLQGNKAGLAVLRKTLLPTIDPSAPLFQFADIWIGISTADRHTELVYLEMQMKEILGKYLEFQLRKLEGLAIKIKDVINLKDLEFDQRKNPQEAHIDLGARNIILAHIDSQIMQLKILASQKEETPAERVERQKKDSGK